MAAPVCLVCHTELDSQGDVLDRSEPVLSLGAGWEIKQHRILVECRFCKTRRVYWIQTTRVDEGDHVKRSLR